MQENKRYNTVQLAMELAQQGGREGAGWTTDALYGVETGPVNDVVKRNYAEELALNGGCVEGAARMTDKLYE